MQGKYLTDKECEEIETRYFGGDSPTIYFGVYPDFYNTPIDKGNSETNNVNLRKKRIRALIERALNQYKNISKRLQAVPEGDTDKLIRLADRAIIHDKRLDSLFKLLEEK